MRKWVLPIPLALALAVIVSGLAGASGSQTHKCKFDVTATFATVAVISGNPPISGSNQQVNTLDGTVCGKAFHGAGRAVNNYAVPNFNGKGINFGPRGALRETFTGTGAAMPNGDITFSGTGKVTGGTGLYKGATGSFTFTGTKDHNSDNPVQHVIGSFKY